MSRAGGHRDRAYARWWIWLAVVFAVAIGLIYIVPLIFSSQPQEELESVPTSITEVDPTTDNNNNSGQQADEQSEQPSNNVSIPEESPPIGAEEAAPASQE